MEQFATQLTIFTLSEMLKVLPVIGKGSKNLSTFMAVTALKAYRQEFKKAGLFAPANLNYQFKNTVPVEMPAYLSKSFRKQVKKSGLSVALGFNDNNTITLLVPEHQVAQAQQLVRKLQTDDRLIQNTVIENLDVVDSNAIEELKNNIHSLKNINIDEHENVVLYFEGKKPVTITRDEADRAMELLSTNPKSKEMYEQLSKSIQENVQSPLVVTKEHTHQDVENLAKNNKEIEHNTIKQVQSPQNKEQKVFFRNPKTMKKEQIKDSKQHSPKENTKTKEQPKEQKQEAPKNKVNYYERKAAFNNKSVRQGQEKSIEKTKQVAQSVKKQVVKDRR